MQFPINFPTTSTSDNSTIISETDAAQILMTLRHAYTTEVCSYAVSQDFTRSWRRTETRGLTNGVIPAPSNVNEHVTTLTKKSRSTTFTRGQQSSGSTCTSN